MITKRYQNDKEVLDFKIRKIMGAFREMSTLEQYVDRVKQVEQDMSRYGIVLKEFVKGMKEVKETLKESHKRG